MNFLIYRAGKPPTGLHLDVLKGDKLIQKLMLDEKKCYLFGRNPQMNDFCIDHASCSRVHAAFVYHKDLNRAFLVDLGSSKYQLFCSVSLAHSINWTTNFLKCYSLDKIGIGQPVKLLWVCVLRNRKKTWSLFFVLLFHSAIPFQNTTYATKLYDVAINC